MKHRKKVIALTLAIAIAPVITFAQSDKNENGNKTRDTYQEKVKQTKSAVEEKRQEFRQELQIKKEELKQKQEERRAEIAERTKVKKTEIEQKRCENAQKRIENKVKTTENIRNMHENKYGNMLARLTRLSEYLAEKEVDVTELNTKIATLEEMIVTMNTELDDFIFNLDSTKTVACENSTEDFKNDFSNVRAQFEKVKQQRAEIQKFYVNEIAPLFEQIKAELPEEEIEDEENETEETDEEETENEESQA